MRRVVLGVAGGIAAYKAAELLRGLTESGCDVTVVPTAAALNFVGAATWSALSGKPVATDVWTGAEQVPHVRLGQQADAIVVAPATADLLARATHGLADDLLTNVLLTARCPVILAPAMHTEMWEHPATQRNVALLRDAGRHRARSGRRSPDGRRYRAGPPPRSAGRSSRPSRTSCGARESHWSAISPASGSWSAPGAPVSRGTRSGSSATSAAGGRASSLPARPSPAAPR